MSPFISTIVRKLFGRDNSEWQTIKPIKDIENVNTFIHRYVLLLTILAIVLFVQELQLRRMCPVVGFRLPNEQTPLVEARIPRGADTSHLFTIFLVGCLITILASGALIGIYLLFIQQPTVVPPVVVPPFVARNVWHKGKVIQLDPLSNNPGLTSDCVVFTQTDTGICHGYEECVEQIESMEYNNTFLPYIILLVLKVSPMNILVHSLVIILRTAIQLSWLLSVITHIHRHQGGKLSWLRKFLTS